MSHSRNEAAALFTKAAVGSGMPWALAQEFARAMDQIPQPSDAEWQAMVKVLTSDTHPVAPQISGKNLILTPAGVTTAGPAAVDWLAADPDHHVTLGQLDAPALLGAYLAAGQTEHGMTFGIEDTSDKILITRLETKPPEITATRPRLDIPPQILEKLTTFAAKTYVPESDASRLSGAGAGLTDND